VNRANHWFRGAAKPLSICPSAELYLPASAYAASARPPPIALISMSAGALFTTFPIVASADETSKECAIRRPASPSLHDGVPQCLPISWRLLIQEKLTLFLVCNIPPKLRPIALIPISWGRLRRLPRSCNVRFIQNLTRSPSKRARQRSRPCQRFSQLGRVESVAQDPAGPNVKKSLTLCPKSSSENSVPQAK